MRKYFFVLLIINLVLSFSNSVIAFSEANKKELNEIIHEFQEEKEDWNHLFISDYYGQILLMAKVIGSKELAELCESMQTNMRERIKLFEWLILKLQRIEKESSLSDVDLIRRIEEVKEEVKEEFEVLSLIFRANEAGIEYLLKKKHVLFLAPFQ